MKPIGLPVFVFANYRSLLFSSSFLSSSTLNHSLLPIDRPTGRPITIYEKKRLTNRTIHTIKRARHN